MNEWLASLKVGDEVAISGSHSACWFESVARITTTKIITDSKRRFTRRTGVEAGTSRSFYSAVLIDPKSARETIVEREEQVKLADAKARASSACYRCNNINLLTQVISMMQDEQCTP